MQDSYKISEVWYTICPVVCPSHIALQKNWLQQEFAGDGIKLSHISTLPHSDWESHFSHRLPYMFREGGNIPPIWARSKGEVNKLIGLVWVDERQSILVAKDSEIKTIADLKGKSVALPRRKSNLIDFRCAMAKKAFIMALKAYGLSEKDVHWVDIPVNVPDIATEKEASCKTSDKGWKIASKTGWEVPQQPEVEALRSGVVDAIFASAGNEVIIERLGAARIIYEVGRHPDWRFRVNINYPYVITVSTTLAKEHPDLVIRWLKVLIKAGLWAKKNPNEVASIEAQAIEAQAIGAQVDSGLSNDELRDYLGGDFHKALVPDLSEQGIAALEMEKDFLMKHGFINNDFDVRGWVDRSFLDEAMKEVKSEYRMIP